MTDARPELPYEKAVEETAKATGKAIDLIGSMTPAIADAYGYLIGDRLATSRVRNLDEITRKTKKILQDRDAQDTQPLPEQIAALLLEHAQGEPPEAKFKTYMPRFWQTPWIRNLATM
jgi:hypothetical protein